MASRRQFIKAVTIASTIGVAGCTEGTDGDQPGEATFTTTGTATKQPQADSTSKPADTPTTNTNQDAQAFPNPPTDAFASIRNEGDRLLVDLHEGSVVGGEPVEHKIFEITDSTNEGKYDNTQRSLGFNPAEVGPSKWIVVVFTAEGTNAVVNGTESFKGIKDRNQIKQWAVITRQSEAAKLNQDLREQIIGLKMSSEAHVTVENIRIVNAANREYNKK